MKDDEKFAVRQSSKSTPQKPLYYIVDRKTGETLAYITEADEASRAIRKYGVYKKKRS